MTPEPAFLDMSDHQLSQAIDKALREGWFDRDKIAERDRRELASSPAEILARIYRHNVLPLRPEPGENVIPFPRVRSPSVWDAQ